MKHFFFPINADHRREIEARGKNGIFIGAGIIEQSIKRNSSSIKNVITNFERILNSINPNFVVSTGTKITEKRRNASKKKENVATITKRREVQKSGEKFIAKKRRKTTAAAPQKKSRTSLIKEWYEEWLKSGYAGNINAVPSCYQAKFTGAELPEKVPYEDFIKTEPGILLLHFTEYLKKLL